MLHLRSKMALVWFVGPFMMLFLVFFVFPIGYSIYQSFFIERIGVLHFVGITNYATALSDSSFWSGFLRVIAYGVIEISVMIGLALTLALIMDTPRFKRWTTILRLVYFLPYAVPGVIAAIMWGFLYTPQLDVLLRLPADLGGHPITPLSSGALLFAIINIAVWGATGYFMMLYVASLSSVPRELYDAAHIDGCSQWQLARFVKIPLLRPTLVLTTVLSMIGALQLFSEPEILSNLTSVSTSYTPNMDIYSTAFSYLDLQYSATLAIILGAITVAASVAFLVATNRGDAIRRPT